MPFDEKLAGRVRKELAGQAKFVEKRMFGGVAFLVRGNMSVGIHRDGLLVRIPADETDAALEEPGARIFDITGRPMKGWIVVGGAWLEDPKSLQRWLRRGVLFAASLPAKTKSGRKKKRG